MGGSARSQIAAADGEIKNTDQKNFGRINLSSESDTNLCSNSRAISSILVLPEAEAKKAGADYACTQICPS